MIFKYTSVKEVMARVIDDVGGKLPSHYFDSMLEWIPQGIRMLETQYQLETKSTGNVSTPDGSDDPKAIFTCNHVAPIPSDLITLLAVEDEYGQRVRLGSAQIDATNQSDQYSTGSGGITDARVTNFKVDTSTYPPVPWTGEDLTISNLGAGTNMYYKIQGNMIQTSLEKAFIKLHYLALPSDQDGYLLVPDVEEYKQALGFYILRQLIGAGFKHPVWNGPQGWAHYDNQWEKYAARALGSIKYPTIDRMERLRAGFAERIIPPYQAYGDFFVGNEQIQNIGNI
jgi:hypothetical protein